MILAGALCLGAAERKALLDYAAGGGTLLLVGPAGTHDEFGRSTPDLTSEKGAVGKGRLLALPFVLPGVVQAAMTEGTFPDFKDAWAFYPSRLWDEPANADQIAGAVAAVVYRLTAFIPMSKSGPR